MRRRVRLPADARLPFDSLLSPESWDLLRTARDESAFAIPAESATWRERCGQRSELVERAHAILAVADRHRAAAIRSYGVGTGCLEWHLKIQRPALPLYAYDFAPQTTQRLRRSFVEADDVALLDIRVDPLRTTPEDLVLLHRIDTEFDDAEWRCIFARLHGNYVATIVIVLTELLTARALLRETAKRFLWMLQHRPSVFAGYVRTNSRARSLWSGLYQIEEEVLNDLPFIVLSRSA